MDADALDVVRRMWIAYREGGAEAGLALLDPDVEFVSHDGRCWPGRDGVRAFFRGFEERGERFQASAFTFEPVGDHVLVVGHRRVQRSEGTEGDYLYFLHAVSDGLITRIVAHLSREAAEREAAEREAAEGEAAEGEAAEGPRRAGDRGQGSVKPLASDGPPKDGPPKV